MFGLIKSKECIITIRDFVRIPFLMFAITGIKLFRWDEADRLTPRHKITIAFVVVNVCFNFVCKVLFPIFDEYDEDQNLTQILLYSTFAVLAVCKMLSVWLGRKSLQKVLMELNKHFPTTIEERLRYRVHDYYVTAMKYILFMTICHWAIACVFITFPIIQSIVEYYYGWRESGEFYYRLPYILTYPFNHRKPMGFLFAYVTQLLAGASVSVFFAGSDSLLMGILYMIFMKFESLYQRITQFKSTTSEADMKELKEMLQYHADLHSFAENINQIFSISILLNYLISIIIFVLIAFQVMSGGVDFFGLFKFIGFLISSLVQVYLLCLFGTKLLTSSEKITEAWCGHEWFKTDIKYQRMLSIAIQRAQRPAHLTAFKFFVISMESFTTLITTAYQLFTILKTRFEDAF